MAGSRLGFAERVRIEMLWVAGWTIPAIAEVVGRARSTLWREINQYHSARHGPKNSLGGVVGGLYRWGYSARWAHERARLRALRPKAPRLGRGEPLRPVVLGLLGRRWSPEQIAAHLPAQCPSDPLMPVSAETIYQAIYVQARGGLRAELGRQLALRSGRAHDNSPWQRGSNENTNGLLRQYFPKTSTDFRTYTQTDLDTVADGLNSRPRQTLAWKTPARALNELLVATTG